MSEAQEVLSPVPEERCDPQVGVDTAEPFTLDQSVVFPLPVSRRASRLSIKAKQPMLEWVRDMQESAWNYPPAKLAEIYNGQRNPDDVEATPSIMRNLRRQFCPPRPQLTDAQDFVEMRRAISTLRAELEGVRLRLENHIQLLPSQAHA